MIANKLSRWAVGSLLVGCAAFAVRAQQPPPADEEPVVPSVAAPDQLGQSGAPAEAEPATADERRRLKFNFRFQRWIDVLEWFAEKADLSLVVDAPPPGTFNYSDQREYTPSEAIDLLNGVLSTKGYTLVRHDRMLTVVNLASGLPDELVPRVTLDELDRRGRYEYVQVLFPLGERPAADVEKEIHPLLSKFGKSVPLPQTRQLLVTDTAGVMRALDAVIQSIPEPAKHTPRPPATPEKPQLVVYRLQTADPTTALEVLKAMLPGAILAVDSRAGQINVYATPSQHVVAQGVLEEMQANVPPDKRPRLEVYPVRDQDGPEWLKSLAPLVPGAKLSLAASGEQLIAFGTPEEQEAVAAAIGRLGGRSAGAAGRQIEVYRLTRADSTATLSLLQSLFPRARLVADKPSRSLIAVAAPEDHRSIAAVLDQLDADAGDAELQRKLVVYPIHEARRKRLETVLESAAGELPDLKVVKDGEPGQLAIWARPAEHRILAELLEQLQREVPGDSKHRAVVYPIKSADPASVLSVMQMLYPGTRFVLDAKARRLLAFGSPDDHQAVRATLDQMDAGSDDDGLNKLMVYPLSGADSATALSVLKGLAPEATLTADAKAGTIVAWARKADHAQIAAALERLSSAPPAVTSQVYRFAHGDPAAAAKVLATIVPAGQIAVDAGNRALVASATAADHARIKATVDQMESGGDDDAQNELRVYPLAGGDVTAALAVLKGLAPAATLSGDAKAGTIMAWASPAEQSLLAAAVERMASSTAALTPQVYRFQRGDPEAAAKILATLVPAARLAVDAGNRSLLANATAADHAQIKAAVDAIDQGNAAASKLLPRTYPLAGVDGTALLSTLQGLFATRTEVRFSLDAVNRKLLALATAEQHEAIRKIVEEAGHDAGLPQTARLEVYPLGNADAATVRQVLGKLVSRQAPAADVSVDAVSRQVVVVAEPQQHEQIRATLERLQGAASDVEVLQLEVLDPATAKTAIGNLFGETDGAAPKVGYDAGTAQLFVRGSREQLARIRELLVKMGESSLAGEGAAGAGRRLRIVPLAGDAQSTLRELQRVWPQLRKNALEVVAPSAISPKLRRQPLQPPATTEPTAPGPSPAPDDALPSPERPDGAALPAPGGPQFAASGPAARPCGAAADEPQDAGTPAKTPPAAEHPPILVAPSGEGLLIASDDTEALDQLEALIRALSRRGTGSGRDFAVYPLQIASAASVAESLERLFQGGSFRTGGSSVVVVPDPRLNAVIVHASRSDRTAIERLIELLDSPNTPESLVANQPVIVPVKNTKATVIERVLRNVYSVQLISGGGRAPVQVPAGISAEMARVIHQVNAAVSGPQMTLSVDEVTNSLVILAARPLVTEVKRLIESLDAAAADDPSRTVEIVPLRKTNVKRVEAALDMLLKESFRRRAKDTRAP